MISLAAHEQESNINLYCTTDQTQEGFPLSVFLVLKAQALPRLVQSPRGLPIPEAAHPVKRASLGDLHANLCQSSQIFCSSEGQKRVLIKMSFSCPQQTSTNVNALWVGLKCLVTSSEVK